MKTKMILLTAAFGLTSALALGQVVVTPLGYSQDFNDIGDGLPSGWQIFASANSTSLGTIQSFTTTATSWSSTDGRFRNSASADGLTESTSNADQNSALNRALGFRQSGSFGDPGISIGFNFSTLNTDVTSLTFDAQMLSVQPRSTVMSIQYGIGENPDEFTTLDTYSDPSEWGITNFSFDRDDFGAILDNQQSVWFRFVALSDSSGSGSRDTIAIDNFSITAIPEPGSLILVGIVLSAAFMVLRCKKV